MKAIEHIIVPVDFYTHSDLQAGFALAIAATFGARITFVHVMRQVVDYPDFEPETLAQRGKNLAAHADRKMKDFLRDLDKGKVVCRGEVLGGEPAEAILTFADLHNADMIILSTHGAQGFEKILIGSIADRVIKGAECPCLVFNPFKKTWRYTTETGTKK